MKPWKTALTVTLLPLSVLAAQTKTAQEAFQQLLRGIAPGENVTEAVERELNRLYAGPGSTHGFHQDIPPRFQTTDSTARLDPATGALIIERMDRDMIDRRWEIPAKSSPTGDFAPMPGDLFASVVFTVKTRVAARQESDGHFKRDAEFSRNRVQKLLWLEPEGVENFRMARQSTEDHRIAAMIEANRKGIKVLPLSKLASLPDADQFARSAVDTEHTAFPMQPTQLQPGMEIVGVYEAIASLLNRKNLRPEHLDLAFSKAVAGPGRHREILNLMHENLKRDYLGAAPDQEFKAFMDWQLASENQGLGRQEFLKPELLAAHLEELFSKKAPDLLKNLKDPNHFTQWLKMTHPESHARLRELNPEEMEKLRASYLIWFIPILTSRDPAEKFAYFTWLGQQKLDLDDVWRLGSPEQKARWRSQFIQGKLQSLIQGLGAKEQTDTIDSLYALLKGSLELQKLHPGASCDDLQGCLADFENLGKELLPPNPSRNLGQMNDTRQAKNLAGPTPGPRPDENGGAAQAH